MKERIRKAWLSKVRGFDSGETVFAASAGKARYQIFTQVRDCWDEVKFSDIRVNRAEWADVRLPAPFPVTDLLTDAQRHCLLHAFGFNKYAPEKAGYRDYFCTHRFDPRCVSLKHHGLMTVQESGLLSRNSVYFILTEAGRAAALSLVPEYAR